MMTKFFKNYFSVMHLDLGDLLKFLNIKRIEVVIKISQCR